MRIGKQRFAVARPFAALVILLGFSLAAPAFAKDNGKDKREWTVSGLLVGKPDKETQQPQVTKNMSGIACATDTGFPRTCVVIDDELQSAQIVTLTDGTITAGKPRMIPLINDTYKGKPVELDGEGVAFADGYFYVIGSHGGARSDASEGKAKARLAASSKLIRLKFDAATGAITTEPAVPPSTALAKLIDDERLFDRFRDKTLEDGGITVEGVAVLGGRLFAGFRGPTLGKNNGRAIILSAELGHFFDDKPADAKTYELKLEHGRGVRDLAAYDDGILILAGPMRSENGTYSVYWWDGVSNQVKLLKDLPDYFSKEDKKKKNGDQWKPEALLPLDRNDKGVRILLLLDSAKDGKPREVRVPYP